MIVRAPLAVLFGLALAVTPAYAQIVLPGGGSGGGSGVSSIATNCPVVAPQTGAVTLNGYLSNSRTVSTTSDTLLSTDCGGVVQYTNSGSIAVAIAASGSTGFTAPGYWVGIKNSGSGTVTVTPATGTINGNATLTVSAGADVQILAFGSGTYVTMNGAGSGGGGGSGTVSSGTAGDCANYPSTGTTVSSSAGVPCPPQFSQVIATYHPLWSSTITTNAAAAAINTAVCSPFIAAFNQHWDQIVTRVGITGTTNDQFAIYPDGLNATSGAHQPVGAATYSSGSIANTGSVGNVITWALGTAGVGQAITQGPNWICFNSGDSTGSPNVLGASSSYISSLIGAIGSGNAGSTANVVALKISQTFGTWPTFTTSSSFTEVTNATAPTYAYRIATTP